MSKKIGLIFNGVWSHYTFAKAPKYKKYVDLLYVYDLTDDLVKDYDALIIPFQSNQKELSHKKDVIYNFLKQDKKIFMEGDCSNSWLNAIWEDRPVNNYWWVKTPDNPPVSETNYEHPVYKGLKPRHACWHTHGVYTGIPNAASIIQKNSVGEIITWETTEFGGTLLATTLDPIVEHGIQQITHLDNYSDNLIDWLIDIKPEGKFEFVKQDFGLMPII